MLLTTLPSRPVPRHGERAAAIEASLRDDILNGSLPPGARLGEVALADRFTVSRGPVREALRRLADAGLIEVVPNVGARVRRLTLEDARTLFELREALEVETARLAARRGEQRAQRLAPHLAERGGNEDFHCLVAELSGNPRIAQLLNEELYAQLALLRCQHRNVQGRGAAALGEHRLIAQAIVAGDEELAGLLMRRHIAASWDSLARQLATY